MHASILVLMRTADFITLKAPCLEGIQFEVQVLALNTQ